MKLRIGIILLISVLFACDRIDTINPGVIVLDGDSRTDGWNCEYRYPYIDLLDIRDSCKIVKTSEGGLSSADLISRAADLVDPEYKKTAGFNIVVVWAGVNDIAVNDTRETIVFERLKSYCLSRKSVGWKVIICTEVSMKGVGSAGSCDSLRTAMNGQIRLHYLEFADGLADLASNSMIGSIGAYQNSTVFCDGIHLTNAGTAAIGKIINQAINDLIP